MKKRRAPPLVGLGCSAAVVQPYYRPQQGFPGEICRFRSRTLFGPLTARSNIGAGQTAFEQDGSNNARV